MRESERKGLGRERFFLYSNIATTNSSSERYTHASTAKIMLIYLTGLRPLSYSCMRPHTRASARARARARAESERERDKSAKSSYFWKTFKERSGNVDDDEENSDRNDRSQLSLPPNCNLNKS